jgi:hypothetical protein
VTEGAAPTPEEKIAETEAGATEVAPEDRDLRAVLEGAPAEERPRTEPRRGMDEARLDSLLGRIDRVPSPIRARRPGDEDSLRWPVDVAEVFAEERHPPDASSFEVEDYHPRFTADYVAANGFFASNVGLAAQSVLQFSDVLGDQIILVGANVYGSLSDSDLLFEYVNLKQRINWGVSAFQFRNDFYIYAAESDDEFVSQMYRGVNLTLQRPFDRFRRMEVSFEVLGVSEEVFRESFSGDFASLRERGTYTYFSPGVAFVTDNTIYGTTGPIGGGRSRLSAEVGVGDLGFHTYVGDLRRYLNVRQRYALAGRIIGATSLGADPQFFRIGGPYTLRGYPFGEYRGTSIALANVEFRFPLIENLRLGFPLPLSLQGVRGALFFDLGTTWEDADTWRAFRRENGRLRLDDLKASYGVSASVNVGFTVLKWDLAWRTDLARNLGAPRGYLSFGLEY